MNRRGFLGAILSTCVAPAIVRASSLDALVTRKPRYFMGMDFGVDEGTYCFLMHQDGSYSELPGRSWYDERFWTGTQWTPAQIAALSRNVDDIEFVFNRTAR